MKIEIERSGGFAGIRKVATVDTENLPKYVASTIEAYFSRPVLLRSMSRIVTGKNNMADYYCYKVSAQTEKKKQEFVFNEFEIDKELKLAVNYIFKNYQNKL